MTNEKNSTNFLSWCLIFSVGFYPAILNQLNIIGDNDINYDSETDEDYTIDEIVIIVLLHIIMKSKLQYLTLAMY